MMKDLIRRIIREQTVEKRKYKPTSSTEEFIRKAKQVHGDLYNYDKVDYVRSNEKVIITCPKHGDFLQTPSDHLKGRGCPICGKEKKAEGRKKTQQEFIDQANKVHRNKFDYSKTNYTFSNEKVIITCPKHGDFLQTPNDHLAGRGCPKCRESRGERYVSEFLTAEGIKNTPQRKFKDCSSLSAKGACTLLPFDFYLPDYNTCIEYDGKQHFEPVFGQKDFENTKRTDELKTKYCKENGIKLIRIKYTMKMDDVDDYLKSELGLTNEATTPMINEVRVSRNERVQLYKDGNIIVVVPLTHRALKKYANSCQWCINSDLSEWEDYHQGLHAIIIQRNPKKIKIGITGRPIPSEIFLIRKWVNNESSFEDVCEMLDYEFRDYRTMSDYFINITNDINNFATNIVYYSPTNGIYDMEDNYLGDYNYKISDIPHITPEVIGIMDEFLGS